MFSGKAYDETGIGETFSCSLTVTETHLVIAAGGENQKEVLVAEAEGKILVANRGAV